MDNRKVYGQYIVGQGKDFSIKENKSGYGFDNSLDPNQWYIVHITGKIIGAYINKEWANNLAIGLDRRDRLRLADEMERILRGDTETPEEK